MSATPACWKPERWPEPDRLGWLAGCTSDDALDEPAYATTLSGPTLQLTWKGYGRWLAFLDANGWLDPATPPLERVNRHRLRAYCRTLRKAGNADETILGRFSAPCAPCASWHRAPICASSCVPSATRCMSCCPGISGR